MTQNKTTLSQNDNIRVLKPHVLEQQFKGCFIAEINSSTKLHSQDLLKFPYRIETFFVLICRKGEGLISVNMNEYAIRENSIFINSPKNILHITDADTNIEGLLLGFDATISDSINFDIKNILPLFLKLHENPVIDTNEIECEKLIKIAESLSDEISHSQDEPYHEEILSNYLSLFMYKLCSIMSMRLKTLPIVETSVKNRNEEYFKRFMSVLSNNYKSERSVSFYASQLCITPKYLTTIIKKVSGHSAAEWIDRYVILEAKNLLRYSTMSIQEVAYHLNFPNQSFFGKYFKHHTGYSPSAYKTLK